MRRISSPAQAISTMQFLNKIMSLRLQQNVSFDLFVVSVCRGSGWAVREAGWKHE